MGRGDPHIWCRAALSHEDLMWAWRDECLPSTVFERSETFTNGMAPGIVFKDIWHGVLLLHNNELLYIPYMSSHRPHLGMAQFSQDPWSFHRSVASDVSVL